MSENKPLIFRKSNYQIMLGGVASIIIGFILMTMETAEYGFGPLGLTIGPAFIMLGLIIQLYAILHKEKSKS